MPAEIEKFENERTAHKDKKQALIEEVQHMEEELEELERSAPKPKKDDPEHGEKPPPAPGFRAPPR